MVQRTDQADRNGYLGGSGGDRACRGSKARYRPSAGTWEFSGSGGLGCLAWVAGQAWGAWAEGEFR
jgi:hypothetical protein